MNLSEADLKARLDDMEKVALGLRQELIDLKSLHRDALKHNQELRNDLKTALDIINGNVADVLVQSLTFEDGAMQAYLKHPLFALFITQMADMWVEQGAINFLEISAFSGVIGSFTITLQKQTGKTPFQLLEKAKVDLQKYRSAINAAVRALQLGQISGKGVELYASTTSAIKMLETALGDAEKPEGQK